MSIRETYTQYALFSKILFLSEAGVIWHYQCEYLCGLSHLWPPFPLVAFFWRGVFVAGLNESNMSLSRGARTMFFSSVVEKNMFVSYRSQIS